RAAASVRAGCRPSRPAVGSSHRGGWGVNRCETSALAGTGRPRLPLGRGHAGDTPASRSSELARMSRRLALPVIVVVASLLAACGKENAPPPVAAADKGHNSAPAGPTLLIAGEDLRTVVETARAEGPVVTGSVQPERRADLRAEVSSVVLQVIKENGDLVR